MRTVNATVDSAIRLPVSGLTEHALRSLSDALSYENPEFAKRKRMGLWLGGTPARLSVLACAEGVAVAPRGSASVVVETLRKHGVHVEFLDERTWPTVTAMAPLWPKAQGFLRDYQVEAVDAVARGRQGVVVAPCGAGKTMIGVGIIARAATRAVVLCHTQDLVDQWVERIQGRLGINAGVLGAGEHDVQTVTVAMVQTLIQADRAEIQALARGVGLLILDEAHHCPAETFRSVVEHFPARYRVGLTATPERSDGLTSVMYWTLGGILHRVTHARLVKCGALAPAEVRPVETRFEWVAGEDGESWNDLAEALVENDERNGLICDLVAREYAAGHVVLVLSGRVEHCGELARLLCARGVPAIAATGKSKKADRQRAIEDVRAGALRVLCASTIADEGLDIPSLTRVVQAFPSRAQGRAIQRLGRLMRPQPGKPTPVLYDIVDTRVPTLRHQWAARRRAYQQAIGA